MMLQELCLATIRSSFDRFCYAYSTTDNNDLRRRFQFLQKIYSSELVTWLDDEHLLPDNYYADLIFSKYLKSVDTAWFLHFSLKTVFDTFSRIGSNIESIFFSEDSKNLKVLLFHANYLKWKNIIIYLPNVKAITYQRFCNNAMLECIAKYCPRLETLDVKHSYSITDDGLKYFYHKIQGKVPCPLLKEIFLESVSVGYETITHLLRNLPLLEKVDYSRLPFALYTMYKNDLGSLDKVEKYNLKHLNLLKFTDLAQTECYDNMLQICITVCPKLKSFYCPLFKLEHLSWSSMLPDVEDLHLDCVNYASIDVNDVLKKKGGKLRFLTLRNCSVSLSILRQWCRHLNELTINVVEIQYNENDSIPMFYNLKALTVINADSSNPGYCKAICRILASSPTLENLCLKKCNSLKSEMKTEILKCCEQFALKHIDFGGSSVETEFIKDILLTCSTLKALNLDIRDTAVEVKYLCRIARNAPNRPELVFTDELNENSSDSVDLVIVQESDELSDNVSDISVDSGDLSDDYS